MDDKELFKALKGTNIGNALVAYLRRLEGEIYDSRNWGDGMTKEGADLAAKRIRKLIDNVIIQQTPKDVNPNICE